MSSWISSTLSHKASSAGSGCGPPARAPRLESTLSPCRHKHAPSQCTRVSGYCGASIFLGERRVEHSLPSDNCMRSDASFHDAPMPICGHADRKGQSRQQRFMQKVPRIAPVAGSPRGRCARRKRTAARLAGAAVRYAPQRCAPVRPVLGARASPRRSYQLRPHPPVNRPSGCVGNPAWEHKRPFRLILRTSLFEEAL